MFDFKNQEREHNIILYVSYRYNIYIYLYLFIS